MNGLMRKLRLVAGLVGEGLGPRGSTLAFNLFALSRLALAGSKIRDTPGAGRIPRHIWMYWAQGFDNAPDLVRRCVESWKAFNPEWRINVLDDATVSDFVDLDDLGNGLSTAHRADILRLRLLERHGGVWVDATCLCRRPLADWLDVVAGPGFFVFARPGPDRLVSNWFIAATPANPAIAAWQARATRYWAGRTGRAPFYTATHYTFHWLVLTNRSVARTWRHATVLSADTCHLAQFLLRGQVEETEARLVLVACAPVLKLTWKYGIELEAVDALLARSAAAVARLPKHV